MNLKIVFTSLNKSDIDFYKDVLPDSEVIFFQDNIDNINIKEIRDATILSIFVFDKLDKDKLSQFNNLKLIITRSTGVDHIDISYCKERGIKVANIPAYSPKSIAEHSLCLLLNLTRKIKAISMRTKDIDFSQYEELIGIDLDQLKVGIIGTGKIGSWMAKICKNLGMDVYAYDIKENLELKTLGIKYINLDSLIEISDVISLHVPYSPKTHHLINKERINKMKNGTIIINTSRGAILDTNALYNALVDGKLGGAGIDVFEDEDILILNKYEKGIVSDKTLKILKLNTLPNVIITPHIAYFTKKAVNNIRNSVVECINMFLKENKTEH